MSNSTGLWGPDTAAPDLTELTVPSERRWGAGSVALVIMFSLAIQVVLAVGAVGLVLSRDHIDLNDPAAAEMLAEKVTSLLLSGPGLLIALSVQWVGFLGGPWFVSRVFGLKSMKRDFGFRFKKVDLLWGLGLGVVLQGAQAVLTSMVDLSDSDNSNMITDTKGIYLPLMMIGACIITPFAEELFFRGFLLRAIMRTAPGGWFPVDENGVPARTGRTGRTTAVVAVLVTSVIFGSLHMTTDGPLSDSLPLMAITGSIGLVFAVVVIKTKRLGITIVAHCVFNTVSLVAALAAAGRLF